MTGIYKTRVTQPLPLGYDGFTGDRQGDLRNHGGPHRTLCQYPAEHYAYWRTLYPHSAASFLPGGFGENISTQGLTESDVCVGDIFRLGSAIIQISQPRMPCWRLSRKLGLLKLAKQMAQNGLSGWLYRTLEPGIIAPGDKLELTHRPTHAITLAALWTTRTATEPDLEKLERFANLEELYKSWRLAFSSRLEYLRKQQK